MALDYSKLSDEELDAIANNDYSRLSDATLNEIANTPIASNAPATSNQDMNQAVAAAGGAAVPVAARYGIPAVASAANAVGQGVRTAGAIAAPAMTAAGDLAKTYISRPGAAVVDLAAHGIGLPPPSAAESAYKGIGQTYQNARDFVNKTGQFTPKPPNQMSQAANLSASMTPEELVASQRAGLTMEQIAAQKAAQTAQAAQATQAAMANPNSQNYMQRMSGLAAKYAPVAGKALKGAGILGAGMALGQGLFGTSDEELAILRAADERKRQSMANQIPR